jgi:hypothetical protein
MAISRVIQKLWSLWSLGEEVVVGGLGVREINSGNYKVLGFFCISFFVQHRIALKTCATNTKVYTGFRFREF